jgi:C4-dicarboxylate-specific signal transduction histidine kinase
MGITLPDLKEYMNRFAGVHVYDGGFRLPHYGDPRNDWLKVEYDHAHRLFISELLPKSIEEQYKETERLRYLPTLRRIIGVVKVDTSRERNLSISITRDRLTETKAHTDLEKVVRYAVDLYAYHEAMRAYRQKQKDEKTEKASRGIEKVEGVLSDYREKIPSQVYHHLQRDLQKGLEEAAQAVKSEQASMLAQLSLLGPLATAGISAIAIQHELRKQFAWLEDSVRKLRALASIDQALADPLTEIADDLANWLERARSTNALFDYMTGDTIRRQERYNARVVVEQVLEQTRFLARGVEIDTKDIRADLYLPEASFAEWGAIFRNVFSNAYNAMLNARERRLKISSKASRQERILLVQDTGRGVNLKKADELFEPFARGMEADEERMRMGYGGTGLGLTIVRLLTERIGCRTRFVEPDEDFATAFSLEWKEQKAR